MSFPYNETFACFTTSGLADISCIIGNGFSSMFGSGLVMVILSMVIGLIVVYKMRLPLELSAIGLLGIVTALSYSVLPGYVFWVGIILLSVISGYGFYKWTRR